MKKQFSFLLMILVFSGFTSDTVAQVSQAQLVVIGQTSATTEALNTGSASFRVENIGDAVSRPFKVRMWVSVDTDFSDDPSHGEVLETDNPRVTTNGIGVEDGRPANLFPDAEGFYPGIETTVVLDRTTVWRVNWNFTYDLPRPDDPFSAGIPDSLYGTLGNVYQFQACIIFIGETECDSAPTSLGMDSTTVVPPRVRGTAIEGDDSIDQIEVGWMEVPFDQYFDASGAEQTIDFVSKYRIRRRDHLGVPSFIELRPDEIQPSMVDGISRFSLIFEEGPNGLTRGKRNSFSIESCHNAETTQGLPEKLVCRPSFPTAPNSNFSPHVQAALEEEFVATQGSRSDGIEIVWEEPVAGVQRYRIVRCLDNSPVDDNCLQFEIDGALTSYLDTNVIRGVSYVYTLSACDRIVTNVNDARFGTCVDGSTSVYKFGKTNVGFVGLVDQFEEDDTREQATLVNNDVLQLHSFDSPTDQDWVKVSVRQRGRLVIDTSSFLGESVDTVITLEDNDGVEILMNDDADPQGAPGSFSRIETGTLEAGDYFLKVEHFRLPGGEFPAPTANNYVLTIDYLDFKAPMTPILKLLLLDD